MPKGLEHFKEVFKAQTDKFIVIGGTACEEHFEGTGGIFRTAITKDIDMVLIVEAYDTEFIKEFWKYIEIGEYDVKEKEAKDRKYYRFIKPKKDNYPKMIELFSKRPEMIEEKEGMIITPIPANDEVASLSAILLDDEYYKYLIENSQKTENFHFAKIHSLICLKAKAYLNLRESEGKGVKVDEANIQKHKNDVFRLATLLTAESKYELPEKLKIDMNNFFNYTEEDHVDFVGLGKSMKQNLDAKKLINLLKNSFDLSNN